MKNNTWKKYGYHCNHSCPSGRLRICVLYRSGRKTNTFTVGKVTIDLEEPEWDKNRMKTGTTSRTKRKT